MPVYRLKAYENTGGDTRNAREPGAFRLVGEFSFTLGDGLGFGLRGALDLLYFVGNGIAADSEGRTWPEGRRNLRVGDLAQAGGENWICDRRDGWVKSAAKHTLNPA